MVSSLRYDSPVNHGDQTEAPVSTAIFISLARISEVHARTMPEDVAVIDCERQWSWREIHEAVLRTVEAIRAQGIGAGQRVACLANRQRPSPSLVG
jgi:acyl-CoA synthetase (AMP-forming)/AMP-acid ligase II